MDNGFKIRILNGDKFYKRNGQSVTEIIDGKPVTGKIEIIHPNFDSSLVRNEHYYGEIEYYLTPNLSNEKKETMNTLINGYSYIEVPEKGNFEIRGVYLYWFLNGFEQGRIKLSHANYEIIGKKLSEDEWRKIVQECKTGGWTSYRDYVNGLAPYMNLESATESGLSLLKSLNLLDKYERGELLILKEK